MKSFAFLYKVRSLFFTLLLSITGFFLFAAGVSGSSREIYLIWKGFFKEKKHLSKSFKAPYEQPSSPVQCGDYILGISQGGTITGVNLHSWKTFYVKTELHPSADRTFCLQNKFLIFGTEDGEIAVFDIKKRRFVKIQRVSMYLLRNMLYHKGRILVKDVAGNFYSYSVSVKNNDVHLEEGIKFESPRTILPVKVVEKRVNPVRACGNFAGFVLDGKSYLIDLTNGISAQVEISEKVEDVMCFEPEKKKEIIWVFLKKGEPDLYILSHSRNSLPEEIHPVFFYSAREKEKSVYSYFVNCYGSSPEKIAAVISSLRIFAVKENDGEVTITDSFTWLKPANARVEVASCYAENGYVSVLVFAAAGEKAIHVIYPRKNVHARYFTGAEIKAPPYFITRDLFAVLDLSPSLLLFERGYAHRRGDVIE